MGVCSANLRNAKDKYKEDPKKQTGRTYSIEVKHASGEAAKKDLKGRKQKSKKRRYRNEIGEDNTIYEHIKFLPKEADVKDVKFIIDSLLNHFFFKTLSNEEM
jgi:hypothetical protein